MLVGTIFLFSLFVLRFVCLLDCTLSLSLTSLAFSNLEKSLNAIKYIFLQDMLEKNLFLFRIFVIVFHFYQKYVLYIFLANKNLLVTFI